ncbi:hypothetical protein ABMA32_15170 [Mesorhizobium sp. VNQ89]|uniref:hypothetical protein n=1 Tax=Mesorhizobium quangtriensis TaxID=3157709 RepID=UPI0032B7BA44
MGDPRRDDAGDQTRHRPSGDTVTGLVCCDRHHDNEGEYAGTLVGRSEAAPRERLASSDDGFSQTTIDGETWRVYTVLNADRGVQVMVGDNLQVLRSLVSDVMTGTLLPMTLVLPIAGLLIWLSVQRAIRPLDRMAGLLRQRQADDLRPVDLPDAPGELRPLSMLSMACSAASSVLGSGRRVSRPSPPTS